MRDTHAFPIVIRLLTTIKLISILVIMEQMVIPVIYQDHHLLVVNKPAGLVVHPTYKHTEGTVWDAILEYLDKQGGDGWKPFELPDKPEWIGAPEQVRIMLRKKRNVHFIIIITSIIIIITSITIY